jgi:hypothetical protein
LDIGVKHVVSFGFESFVKHPSLLPMIKDMIETFCLKFYERLFKNVLTIDQAFKNTFTECFESHFNTMIEKCMTMSALNQEEGKVWDNLLQEGPTLSPFKTMVH